MIKFGKTVVKLRIPILIISLLLLIPSGISYFNTKVNYDILSYLPSQIDTMKGQDILLDKFGTGAFSFVVLDGMEDKDIKDLAEDVKKVDHVKKVVWYGSIADASIPTEVLPSEVESFFKNREKNSQLMIVLYDKSMGDDVTMEATDKIQGILKKDCFVSGMSAVLRDTKQLSEKEVFAYVVISAVLCFVVLSITMDSFIIPILFLFSIGMAVIYNLGTNFVQGQISYITQALAAVLQLAVTMDYSIFLWHSYQENQERYGDDHNRAMAHAVSNTITSVVGSSITTVAGFVALCFMSFTLGLDLGVVMAKGVVFGVLGCVTVLPSMILVCDKLIEKTRHRVLLPDMGIISDFVVKHFKAILLASLIILIPSVWGYTHTDVYYDLAGTMPDSLMSKKGNNELAKNFDMGATSMILTDSSLSPKESRQMIKEIKDLKGVKLAVSLDSIAGPTVPEEVIPTEVKKELKSGKYQLMLVTSEYKTASDEVNAQCKSIEKIIKRYDKSAKLVGEAPCTKDLINITNDDFKRVSVVSIGAIFIIILLVFKSISLPFILVAVIEFAIFINMGIPAYTHTTLPFIASIVIGTIQLGATVDYAILMTNKYKKNRYRGMSKRDSINVALESATQSIIVSALTFFAATFGVGMYSQIDMIGSLCSLLSRGAIISMFVVILVLPSMFMVFDRIICSTSAGFKGENFQVTDNGINRE